MFKQMITLYGQGFNEQKCRNYIPLIHSNIFQTMTVLFLASVKEYPITIQESNLSHRQTFLSFSNKNSSNIPDNENTHLQYLSQEWAERIQLLWQDPEIRQLYNTYCEKLELQASAAYFLDKVILLAHESYLPSDPDIYRCRSRTIGIIEQHFKMNT
jgi:guanine nucleotide-binding protein G(t) subunit alpha 3